MSDKVIHIRYDARQEADVSWTVFESSTGLPVKAGVAIAMGMEEESARYLVGILNSVEPVIMETALESEANMLPA